jgi:hypothetical protein
MSFLNPQFLFALFAVSIPILIHFFNLQRPRKVLFPNVRFLKEIQHSTSNRLKLKHLLILLSRILFVVFLVLAFAQPYWSASDSMDKKGKAAVEAYVDNSYSMLVEREEGKAFDQSVNSALKLPEAYPGNTRFELLTNDFEGKDVVFRSKESFAERLSELRYSGGTRSVSEVMSRSARQMGRSDADRKHVYWFSDFQKSTFDTGKIKPDSSIMYYWIPMQNESIHNVFVDTAWISSPVIRENENVELHCKLFNSGATSVNDLTIKLFVDGIQLSAQNVSMEADAGAELSFRFAVQGKGYKKAEIRFDDQPVTFDNQYYLTFRVSPVVRVLHLFEKNPVLGGVYSGEPMFALTSRPVGDFNYAQIEQSDLIVLEGISTIPDALIVPLKEFTTKGGSVALVPSYSAKAETYQSFLSAFGISGLTIESVDTSKRASAQLAPPDFNHPFFSDFFERRDARLLMPFAFPAITYTGKGESLLKYRDGNVFLSKMNYQKGAFYLFSSGLNEQYTDFARHSLLVPVFYKIGFWSIAQQEQLSYTFNQQDVALKIDFPALKNFELVKDSRRTIPAQRMVAGRLLLNVADEAMVPGFYDLYYQDSLVRVMAFNFGKNESIMKFMSKEDLEKFAASYKNIKILDPGSSETFANTIKNKSIGAPLWKYCVVACLLFLLAETLLIRYFRQATEKMVSV